jgi:hypothetical protein
VHISEFKPDGFPFLGMGCHTPSNAEGDYAMQNGFLGIVWISIPKCYGWKSLTFQTAYRRRNMAEGIGLSLK